MMDDVVWVAVPLQPNGFEHFAPGLVANTIEGDDDADIDALVFFVGGQAIPETPHRLRCKLYPSREDAMTAAQHLHDVHVDTEHVYPATRRCGPLVKARGTVSKGSVGFSRTGEL